MLMRKMRVLKLIMIKLKGLFGISLGGFPCIRGYARLGDLAKISSADPDYQRNLLSGHKEEITQFCHVNYVTILLKKMQ